MHLNISPEPSDSNCTPYGVLCICRGLSGYCMDYLDAWYRDVWIPRAFRGTNTTLQSILCTVVYILSTSLHVSPGSRATSLPIASLVAVACGIVLSAPMHWVRSVKTFNCSRKHSAAGTASIGTCTNGAKYVGMFLFAAWLAWRANMYLVSHINKPSSRCCTCTVTMVSWVR